MVHARNSEKRIGPEPEADSWRCEKTSNDFDEICLGNRKSEMIFLDFLELSLVK